jgi:arylsulfatase
LYDGCIHQADARVGRIVEALKRRDEFDNTLLVVTSDHGEGFGETSRVQPGFVLSGHGAGIHEVKTHVPLIVKFPNQDRRATVDQAASAVRFSQAVESVLSGSWEPDEFVPDGPVVVSAPVNMGSEILRKHGADPEPHQGVARAIYQDAGEGVIKQMTWRSGEATVVVRDAQTSYKVSNTTEGEVDRVFNQFSDAGVKEGSTSELDDLTLQRMRRLGYID